MCVLGASALWVSVPVPAPVRAQTLADLLAPLALDPQDTVRPAPGLRCATPPIPMSGAAMPFGADPARANVAGDMEPLADGRPLRADQFPRFLHPTHQGSFGFTDFLVLGDHASVTFERVGAENDHTAETWARTGTDTVAGHLVSVFSPAWDAAALREALRRYSWGVDEPSLYWGRLVVPGSGDGDGHDHVNVHLALAPSNVPASPVVRIDDRVQYASHVVNIRDDDFGDSRILGGDTALNLPEITKLFYEYFTDEYEVIAVVSRTVQLAGYAGFHQMVRNDIGGIGPGSVRRIRHLRQCGSAGGGRGLSARPLGQLEDGPPRTGPSGRRVLHRNLERGRPRRFDGDPGRLVRDPAPGPCAGRPYAADDARRGHLRRRARRQRARGTRHYRGRAVRRVPHRANRAAGHLPPADALSDGAPVRRRPAFDAGVP